MQEIAMSLLVSTLADALLRKLLGEKSGEQSYLGPDRSNADHTIEADDRGAAERLAREVAEDLVDEARRISIPLESQGLRFNTLSGGNTAEAVLLLEATTTFVMKADRADSKLAREAKVLRQLRENPILASRFREALPVIYAIRDRPPYAYLMQYFPKAKDWQSLEDRLYPPQSDDQPNTSECIRWLSASLDVLFSGYESYQNKRLQPSVMEDYVERISLRLNEISELDNRYLSQRIQINGQDFLPWQDYLDEIMRHTDFVSSLSPGFSTVVHGDPNPGNLMLLATSGSIDVKLIDPKDWLNGDYLFDIAKITHFLEATGPIEKATTTTDPNVIFEQKEDAAVLNYQITKPEWTGTLVNACLDRASAFALQHGDNMWQARYELGMAANILGLPIGRFKKGRTDEAIMLFGEGMFWLKKFCDRLPTDASQKRKSREPSRSGELLPEVIKNTRDFVKANVPDVAEATDRRGYQLLHWQPVHLNQAEKPIELSLEYEARMAPRNREMLRKLHTLLPSNSDERIRVGGTLLEESSRFSEFSVERSLRKSGAQSVDRYWDTAQPVDHKYSLIPRGISFRERVQTRDFMTWTSGDPDMRALNLELPLVHLNESDVIARLEYNWIDAPKRSFATLANVKDATKLGEPLAITASLDTIPAGEYVPIIEHTTFREKFLITRPGEANIEAFQLNIDHITAQCLSSGRVSSYVDVDVAPSALVDEKILDDLKKFSNEISDRYMLGSIPYSKAWRDANILGLL